MGTDFEKRPTTKAPATAAGISVCQIMPDDASAAARLGELGYPAAASEICGRLSL